MNDYGWLIGRLGRYAGTAKPKRRRRATTRAADRRPVAAPLATDATGATTGGDDGDAKERDDRLGTQPVTGHRFSPFCNQTKSPPSELDGPRTQVLVRPAQSAGASSSHACTRATTTDGLTTGRIGKADVVDDASYVHNGRTRLSTPCRAKHHLHNWRGIVVGL